MLTEMYEKWLHGLWGEGDHAVAEQLVDENLVDHNRLPDQPAGRAGELWAVDAVRRAFPDLTFTLDVCFESGDLVTGRWTMTGTHTGTLDLIGIPPTGRPVAMSGQEIFRVKDGKFVEVWHVEDIGQMQRAMGMEPPKAMLRMAARRSARKYKRGRR